MNIDVIWDNFLEKIKAVPIKNTVQSIIIRKNARIFLSFIKFLPPLVLTAEDKL